MTLLFDESDHFDICVVGAGFGGSLIALILRKLGFTVVLVDKGKHPRFAIGESSTPIGNRVLSDLCKRYDLPEIAPLCKWGSWQRTLPHLRGGLKRGFTYFFHDYDNPFEVRADHHTELLVAASRDNENSDTHWLRADVDQYFCRCAVQAGVVYHSEVQVFLHRNEGQWEVNLRVPVGEPELTVLQDGRWDVSWKSFREQPRDIKAKFFIHAAGPSRELASALELGDDSAKLRTSSRGLYAHFSNLTPWAEFMRAHHMPQGEHPYPCDNAAIHQVFPGGWMWQLRFSHQVVSAGFSLKDLAFDAAISPDEEFRRWLLRLPSLDEQMRARVLDGEGPQITRTGRMQRLTKWAAGEGFALLPFSAGFISPLQSTGIAHTFTAIERLARFFEGGKFPSLKDLAFHNHATLDELVFIDELISTCYETTHRPELFHLAIMTYFAAVTTYERLRSEQGDSLEATFIGASDPRLREKTREAAYYLRAAAADGPLSASGVEALTRSLQATLKDFDSVGLFEPKTPRMYEYTAAPEF